MDGPITSESKIGRKTKLASGRNSRRNTKSGRGASASNDRSANRIQLHPKRHFIAALWQQYWQATAKTLASCQDVIRLHIHHQDTTPLPRGGAQERAKGSHAEPVIYSYPLAKAPDPWVRLLGFIGSVEVCWGQRFGSGVPLRGNLAMGNVTRSAANDFTFEFDI